MRKYSKEFLSPVIKESMSFAAEVLRKIGVKQRASIQSLIKKRIEYGIDFSHFLGKATNCGKNHKGGPSKKNWSDILVKRTDGTREKPYRLRRALIESGRRYCCENLGCMVDSGKWLGKDITLNVDHRNGDFSDCRPMNVRFLCPNCHSQTDNFSGSKGYTGRISDSMRQKIKRKLRSSGETGSHATLRG